MIKQRRILGIDPGSRLTGFGVLDFDGDKPTYVASGTVKSLDGTFPDRLKQIFIILVDISGYTNFIRMHKVSLLHAEKIIGELMESILDASKLR